MGIRRLSTHGGIHRSYWRKGNIMVKKLESDMVPLTKLFSQDFFFRIPEYQRPLLWDDEDFTNLIDDLSTAQRDEPYFLAP
jgi:uncharacterized protein with ParB-like and HNH nuclease domain